MAAIDKIYCNSKNDFLEFYNWCEKVNNICKKETQLSLLDYFYITPNDYIKYYDKNTKCIPITNFRESLDMWLLYHCPIKWVRNYIMENQYPDIKLNNKKIMLYYV